MLYISICKLEVVERCNFKYYRKNYKETVVINIALLDNYDSL